jgi:hypothetical protein
MGRLDFVEMCIALEDAFDVEIDDTRRFRTVFEVAAFLAKRGLPRYAAFSTGMTCRGQTRSQFR